MQHQYGEHPPNGPEGRPAYGYEADGGPAYGPAREHRAPRRRTGRGTGRRKRLWLAGAVVAVLGLAAVPVLNAFDVFSDNGDPMSFDRPRTDGGGTGGSGGAGGSSDGSAPGVRMPTGPQAQFTTANTLDDGTKIGVTTLHGKKSGFTGRVWVWAPKEYYEDKYAKSAFPVLIALPGGPGYPVNYWMGTDLKLQSSISEWSTSGKSKPFIVVMPVLNADDKNYYDGSDIPGQPKMGTWMSDDVPDLVKANFRTFTSRDGWAFMGSSSGAYVGLKQVLQHPDRFKAVIASGPDTRPDSPLWRGHEKERRANDPEQLAKHLIARPGAPDVHIAFQIGTKEGGRAKLEAFMKKIGKGPIKTRLQVIEGGGHNARGYVRGMNDGSMEWISKVMPGPTPAP
ncbi:alpha/beta hydrolase [Streptomyces paromomycinus]|uniref:Esterase n=1 Tax=Streptomyces paromomycinus TaxID=92743 RepID=A0A401W687_STREY|nr:alpha/beta hydrolase-fold protein [Streptomyces paromomycinus]GCD44838.1 esterase [Streptomyces paromomycinus]